MGIVESTGKIALTVHTGSRNFGKQVCDYHQNKAWMQIQQKKTVDKINYIQKLKYDGISGKELAYKITQYTAKFQTDGITKNDAFLTGKDMYEYMYDMVIAQTYASWNRKTIITNILKLFNEYEYKNIEYIESVHNYIDMDDFVIRKGSIRSYTGEKMIIPFNSHDGILICEGKSNEEWNNSAPHGAGRLLSRSEANRTLTDDDVKNAMVGVFASETPTDESPLCYKSADFIENAIKPTAEVINRIKPIINFKA